jgi:hypothetical protein
MFAAVGALQRPIWWLTGDRWLGHDSEFYCLFSAEIKNVYIRHMSSWRIREQPAGNICTQGRENGRWVEKITSGGTPKFVVCRRCNGDDQMKKDDMDDTYSMHGRDD